MERVFEKNRLYSVRSAYRLLKNDQAAKAMATTEEAGPACQWERVLLHYYRGTAFREARASREDRAWSLVWKLNVPPKVVVFWWGVLHNFLPSKMELKRRHIAPESHYEMCGDLEENLFHVVFQCMVALGGSGLR